MLAFEFCADMPRSQCGKKCTEGKKNTENSPNILGISVYSNKEHPHRIRTQQGKQHGDSHCYMFYMYFFTTLTKSAWENSSLFYRFIARVWAIQHVDFIRSYFTPEYTMG